MSSGYPLIQLIEYDWALVVRCRACGHTARWGADALVERFRDQLRATVVQVAAKVADHCGQRPTVYHANGAGMEGWTISKHGKVEQWTFRDMRLRAFLIKHGLPSELADERKRIADAWLADNSPARHVRA